MNKYRLTMDQPSSWWGAMWREAMPTGNGTIGAAVYGAVYDEKIMVTHEDLWWKEKTQPLPDVSSKLEGIRKDLLDGNPEEARFPMCKALEEEGYNPHLSAPLPLCDIKIHNPLEGAFSKYSRQLDMATGVITVLFNDGDTRIMRDAFVSKADDLIVCRVSTSSDEGLSIHLSLDFHDLADAQTKADNITLSAVTDMDAYLPKNKQLSSKENYLFYSAMNEDGKDFGAVAKVVAKSTEFDGSVMKVKGEQEILILVKPYVKSDHSRQNDLLFTELETMDMSYDLLLERHCALHTPLMKKASFDLGGSQSTLSNEQLLRNSYTDEAPIELMEKLWLFGRYLLVSSTGNSSQPCHLYGLWCGEYQGMWAFNMLNENVEMIYWQALSGNMPETMLSMFEYYESMMDDFRTNAQHLFGCRGIYIPAATTPESGLLKLVLPHILYWTGGAGWLAQHYFDYYRFTGDEEFLRNRALPFMKEAILFYEDFLLIDDQGYYTSLPSNSPENTPGNFWGHNGVYGTHKDMETTINATMDFAIIKELLSNLIKVEEILDIKDGQEEKWVEMLTKVPPYQLNVDNTVKEWMHPLFEDNHHHRHLSHLYPLFPGTEVTKTKEPELFQAYVKTLNKRMAIGLKEQSGWSIAHLANCFARVGDGDQSLNCIEILTRSCMQNNFYTTHNDWRSMGVSVDLDWAPIQVDANMGITAAMNEMIVTSVEGEIYLLPALPSKWTKGKVTNLLVRGPIEVSIEWNIEEKFMTVTLLALQKTSGVDLVLPDIVSSCKEMTINNGRLDKVELSANRAKIFHFNL